MIKNFTNFTLDKFYFHDNYVNVKSVIPLYSKLRKIMLNRNAYKIETETWVVQNGLGPASLINKQTKIKKPSILYLSINESKFKLIH